MVQKDVEFTYGKDKGVKIMFSDIQLGGAFGNIIAYIKSVFEMLKNFFAGLGKNEE